MTDKAKKDYAYYTKVAWIIYALTAIVLAAVLVLFVASDNEEMFFYGLMTPAAFYVFRPTERFFSKQIFKFTGVSKPEEDK
jgi:hypothetical protein